MTDPKDPRIQIGSIVQVHPELCPEYAGEFIIVTEIKNFGIQGYFALVHPRDLVCFEGIAYIRMRWEKIRYIGDIIWKHRTVLDYQNDSESAYQDDRSK